MASRWYSDICFVLDCNRSTDDPADDTTNGNLNNSTFTETDNNVMMGCGNINENDLVNSLEMSKIELANINAEKYF